MKIIVDTKNYTPCKYDEFTYGTTKAGDSPYVVGQVVVIKDRSDRGAIKLGVVLGCIGHEAEELRTDMCGMVSYDQIRPANIKDFGHKNIKTTDRLIKEVQGYKVSYNWETYETTVADI
jgi:hypothetical protein